MEFGGSGRLQKRKEVEKEKCMGTCVKEKKKGKKEKKCGTCVEDKKRGKKKEKKGKKKRKRNAVHVWRIKKERKKNEMVSQYFCNTFTINFKW